MALLSFLASGAFAMWTILAVGLFNSIMFPTIFTLAVAELGPLTGRGSGLLVQAIVGGAVFPVLMGHLADRFGIRHALLLPFLCYLYVIYYGSSFRWCMIQRNQISKGRMLEPHIAPRFSTHLEPKRVSPSHI